MDWSDVTEWHPVNNDIIPNGNHEDKPYYPATEKPKKYFQTQ